MELKIGDKVIDLEHLEYGKGIIKNFEYDNLVVEYEKISKHLENNIVYYTIDNIKDLQVIDESGIRFFETKGVDFTEDEKAILRNLPEEYKWIARNETNLISIYTAKPNKVYGCWHSGCLCAFC